MSRTFRSVVIGVIVAFAVVGGVSIALAHRSSVSPKIQYKLNRFYWRPSVSPVPRSQLPTGPPVEPSPQTPLFQDKIVSCADGGCGSDHDSLFNPTTQWTHGDGDLLTFVLAGSDSSDSSRGGIQVIASQAQNTLPETGVYYPKDNLGPLTLTDVQGDIVSFSYNGGQGTFDMSTNTFGTGGATG